MTAHILSLSPLMRLKLRGNLKNETQIQKSIMAVFWFRDYKWKWSLRFLYVTLCLNTGFKLQYSELLQLKKSFCEFFFLVLEH